MAPKKLALKYLRAKNSFDLRSVASQTLKMTEKRILYTLLIFSCFAMIYGSTKSGKGLLTKIVELIKSLEWLYTRGGSGLIFSSFKPFGL